METLTLPTSVHMKSFSTTVLSYNQEKLGSGRSWSLLISHRWLVVAPEWWSPWLPSPLLGPSTLFICGFILVNLPATPPAPGFRKDCREATVPVASGCQVCRRFFDTLSPWIFLTFFFRTK